jgi:peptidoglycan-N-acetylglucosamine deacetylase
MDTEEARAALKQAGKALGRFSEKLVSFRAPNLQFPAKCLKLLEEESFLYDSSLAAYSRLFPEVSNRK